MTETTVMTVPIRACLIHRTQIGLLSRYNTHTLVVSRLCSLKNTRCCFCSSHYQQTAAPHLDDGVRHFATRRSDQTLHDSESETESGAVL
jgi:dethiobiotin synthetase